MSSSFLRRGGKGGKGRRRLPIPTFEVIETLTKYYISVFWGRIILQIASSTSFILFFFFLWRIYRGRGWEEKAWLEPVLGAHPDVARGLSSVDYQTLHTIAGDNPGALSFSHLFVVSRAQHARVNIRCLLPRFLRARRAGSLLACLRMHLFSLCVAMAAAKLPAVLQILSEVIIKIGTMS